MIIAQGCEILKKLSVTTDNQDRGQPDPVSPTLKRTAKSAKNTKKLWFSRTEIC